MPITVDQHTDSQRAASLQRANDVRIGVAELRAELAAGELELVDALKDPRAGACPIHRLLISLPRYGPVRARKLLWTLNVRETKRVGDLTDRQRAVIAELVGATR